MKKRKVFLGIALLAAVVCVIIIMGYNSRSGQAAKVTEVKKAAVSFEPITNHDLHNQLSEQEKEIYADIVEKLDNYQGGEVRLKEQISPKSLARISDTIRYDGERKYWYFVVLYPFDEENVSVLTGVEQPKEDLERKSISKILIEVDLGENQWKLENFALKYDEEKNDKLSNYKEFKTILEEAEAEEYYQKIDKEIAKLEQQIIDGMPKDITQEEAAEYVGKWMLENLDYDTDMLEINGSADWTFQELTDLMRASSKACVVEKKGLCSGLSAFMADVLNKVGIDAKLVFGTVGFNGQKTAHAWVQVNIEGDIFYKDPTYENMYHSTKKLWNKEQLKERRYRFSTHFKW